MKPPQQDDFEIGYWVLCAWVVMVTLLISIALDL
jgi:hypothetical protein